MTAVEFDWSRAENGKRQALTWKPEGKRKKGQKQHGTEQQKKERITAMEKLESPRTRKSDNSLICQQA